VGRTEGGREERGGKQRGGERRGEREGGGNTTLATTQDLPVHHRLVVFILVFNPILKIKNGAFY